MSELDDYNVDEKRLVDYWRVLLRYRISIVSITFFFCLLGFAIASSIKPEYKSQVKLLVEPEAPVAINSETRLDPFMVSSFYLSQLELIRSRSLAETVIKKMKIEKHGDFHENRGGTIIDTIRGLVGQEISKKYLDNQYMAETKNNYSFLDFAIAGFGNRLHVNNGINKEMMIISYKSGDPNLAARVANEVAASYITVLESKNQEGNLKNIQWLTKNLEDARSKLVKSEAELQEYQERVKVGDSKDINQIKSGKIGSITGELMRARTERIDLEIRYKQITDLQATGSSLESIPEILANSVVQKLKQDRSEARKLVNEYNQRYGDKHPKMNAARSDLASANRRLKLEINSVIDSIKKQYQVALKSEQAVQREYDKTQSEGRSLKGTQFEVAKLEMEVTTNKQIYDLLLTRLREADLRNQRNRFIVKIVDTAKVPTQPFEPNVKAIVLRWFSIGLFLSLVISFIRDNLDTTIKTGDDLEARLGLPLLGIFPRLTRRDLIGHTPERIAAERPRSSISEAVNNIRTNIIFSSTNQPPQVIAVTSAVASEGKTTISSNLGIAMARLGPTLILEVDTRRPRMSNLSRSRKAAGLFEFVTGKAKLKEAVVMDPKIKNLYTMPVVSKPAKPLEFLSSKRFEEALLLLRKKFKYIVLDTPPILPVSDAIVMAPLVDGVVLIVGAESTKYPASKEALARLRQVKAEVIGTVLSKGNPRTLRNYGQGYYYGYDYYHEKNRKAMA
ncbi:MAG: polysaccharide biosynthesis tyrosine autokinase [Gammaproteobacteria bacterium]|nr:polysaccharide biosynthesis tyrosine autokinase [Gammaproteobacteria bacterium]